MIPVNTLPPADTAMEEIQCHIHNVAKSKKSTYELLKIEEKAMNDFLDTINRIKGRLDTLTKGGNELHDLIKVSYFTLNKKSFIKINKQLTKLNRGLIETYVISKSSGFYKSAPTTVEEFKNMADNLRELQEDINIFQLSLPKDEEYKEISNQLNLLF